MQREKGKAPGMTHRWRSWEMKSKVDDEEKEASRGRDGQAWIHEFMMIQYGLFFLVVFNCKRLVYSRILSLFRTGSEAILGFFLPSIWYSDWDKSYPNCYTISQGILVNNHPPPLLAIYCIFYAPSPPPLSLTDGDIPSRTWDDNNRDRKEHRHDRLWGSRSCYDLPNGKHVQDKVEKNLRENDGGKKQNNSIGAHKLKSNSKNFLSHNVSWKY